MLRARNRGKKVSEPVWTAHRIASSVARLHHEADDCNPDVNYDNIRYSIYLLLAIYSNYSFWSSK